jgi:hypothetical protein
MKAKDLTQADVGKWVTLRSEVSRFDDSETRFPVEIIIPNSGSLWIDRDTILEFTDPPAPVQEVGDVFRMLGGGTREATLVAIVNDVCLLIGPVEDGRTKGFQSARYPLDPELWTFVR